MTAVAMRYLTAQQIDAYRREGYLAVPELIDRDRVNALRAVTEELVERSRSISRSNELFDLDPRHTAEAPELRRIKNPADNHPLYE